jgi:hypothetical protein
LECLANLREAIKLILEYRRDDSLRSMLADAQSELVVVGVRPSWRTTTYML